MLNNNMVNPHFMSNSNVNFNGTIGSYPNRSRGGHNIPLHHLHSYQQHQHLLQDKQQIQVQDHQGEQLIPQEYRQHMQTTYGNIQHNHLSSSPNTDGNTNYQNLP